MVWVLVVAGLLTWAGATLIISAVSEARSRSELGERLRRHQPRGLADEAEYWLRYLPGAEERESGV